MVTRRCPPDTDAVTRVVIEGCHVAVCDEEETEYTDGHVVLDGARILAVGAGAAPGALREGAQIVDGRGCLATPGLINTHHHLYQWITRAIATDSTLFGWLTTLYPMWARHGSRLRAGHHHRPGRRSDGRRWSCTR
jgi:cytosine/adenosine deaminase-related metal-dependent hydrolase